MIKKPASSLASYHRPLVALCGLLALLIALGTESGAAPFQNGSFETNGGFHTSTIAGWNVSGDADVLTANNEGLTDGDWAVVFDAGLAHPPGVLSQTFTTTPGQEYAVHFDLGGYGYASSALSKLQVEVLDGTGTGANPTELIEVGTATVEGTTGGTVANTSAIVTVQDNTGVLDVNSPAPNDEFSVVTVYFTALSDTSTLAFTDLSDGGHDDRDLVLDNVQVGRPSAAHTKAATEVTTSAATLNGVATPDGATGTVTFEYGPTTDYGTEVNATPSTVNSGNPTPVSARVSDLAAGSIYHFRLNCATPGGLTHGSDVTFRTISTDASLSSLSLGSGPLDTAFAPETLTYTATIHSAATTVSAAVTTAGATITVNGTPLVSGTYSDPIELDPGVNTLLVVVTAEDGVTTRTYGIDATPAPLNFTFTSANALAINASDFSAAGPLNLALGFPPRGATLKVVNSASGAIHGTFSNYPAGQFVSLTFDGVTYHYIASYAGGHFVLAPGVPEIDVQSPDHPIDVNRLLNVDPGNNQPVIVTFVIRNKGGDLLSVEKPRVNFVVGDPEFPSSADPRIKASFTILDTPPAILVPGEQTTVRVRVLMNAPASIINLGPMVTAYLHIGNNDDEDHVITMSVIALPPTIPAVVTTAVTGIGTTTATMNGNVNAKGTPDNVTFTYAAGNMPATIVAATPPSLSTDTETPVSATLTGLRPRTTYTFHVQAGSESGQAAGTARTFTTANSTPVAGADSFLVSGAPTFLNLLANDVDADGDTLKLVSTTTLSPSTAGKLTLKAGALTFTPSATFTGASFQYTVSDGFGGTATATVTLGTAGTFTITPETRSSPAAGESYSIAVTTDGVFSVSESLPWASVSPANGSANSSVTVTVQPNTSKASRTGTLAIGTRTHTITQAGVVKPSLGPVISPAALVGSSFTLSVPLTDGPAKFGATHLPPGLSLDSNTGVVSGVPTAAGSYGVTVTAKNASAPADPLTFTIEVAELNASLVGTFHGLIERDLEYNRSSGSRFQLTSMSSGTVTGKLQTGSAAISFSGRLVTANGDPAHASLHVSLPSHQNLALAFDAASDSLAGTLTTDGTRSALVEGWRNIWQTAPSQASAVAGYHTFYLAPRSALDGYGFGSFTVDPVTGLFTAIGKMTDGHSFSSGSFVGPQGQVLLYDVFPGNAGCLVGTVTLHPGTHIIDGNPYWAQTPPGEVGPSVTSTVTATGGLYTPPGAGQLALGLTAGENNAILRLNSQRWDDDAINQLCTVSNTTATSANVVTFPTGDANFNVVHMKTFDTATGSFSGTFSRLTNTGTFQGIIVPTANGPRAVGFLLWPERHTGAGLIDPGPVTLEPAP